MSDRPARLRGAAAGLLTGTLTLAAHGVGGAGVPAGAAAGHLLVVATVVGAVAATAPRAGDARVLLGLLAAGQVVGHAALSAQGHLHTTGGAQPAWLMPAAHAVAIVVGAVLISAGDRLCRALCRVARRATRPQMAAPVARRLATAAPAAHPMQSALLLACSISHRGPPVGAVR